MKVQSQRCYLLIFLPKRTFTKLINYLKPVKKLICGNLKKVIVLIRSNPNKLSMDSPSIASTFTVMYCKACSNGSTGEAVD